MLIIAGYLKVDPARRDEYISAHQDLLRRGRAAPGCLDLAISADSLDPGRVNNFERWESREHLDAWRKVAAAPNTGISFIGGYMMEYTVVDECPPFDTTTE
uniref:Antibiotic biosynthesis monooxygenase n=1 Tax=Thermosporothrix sp. COM3 TaxID=2490863 RepID=A0A455SMH2_9CHLR|nr:antibiotic biosynthesis monooxygenase [Thermosporothrix sp. COM3]